jgi:ribosomal protein L16 Arg81 hydroxylase
MSPNFSAFSTLISPLSQEEFFLNYFDQQCFQMSGTPERFAELFTWDDFENVVAYHHFDESRVKLVKGMQNVRLSQPVSNDLIQKYLKEGFTLVIDDVSRKIPQLDALIKGLREELSEAVFMNLYFTPVHSQGFGKHHDMQDVFIFQIEGEKEWHLFSDSTNDSSPQVLSIEKGDVLYIPKGVPHLAKCKDVHSLHLTIGISYKNNFKEML